jgi:hypothetical protein
MLEDSRQLLKLKEASLKINNIKEGVYAASVLVGGLGIGIAGYAVYDWVNESSILEDIKKWIELKKRNVKSTAAGDGPATHGNTNIFGLPGWGLWEGVI